MTVSKKRKRPITVRDMDLLWWVEESSDHLSHLLKIVSPDGAFFVEYLLAPISGLVKEGPPCVYVSGPTLCGNSKVGGFAGCFASPDFGAPQAVSPRFVSEIVGWVIDDGPLPDLIDWPVLVPDEAHPLQL